MPQPDDEFGVHLLEPRHGGRSDPVAKTQWRRDVQCACQGLRRLLHRGLGGSDGVQNAKCVVVKQSPVFGGMHSARGASEQPHAKGRSSPAIRNEATAGVVR